jgi:hypothetical protein
MKRDQWTTGLEVLAQAIGGIIALAIWRVAVAVIERWAR